MHDEQVTIVIPSIPPRAATLGRAVASAAAQTVPPAMIISAVDVGREGAWSTRNRGLAAVTTDWTGFVDDDDELYPFHVELLLHLAAATQAELVWGWFDVEGGDDPFPMHRGKHFDPDAPHIVPITYLVRTRLLHDAVRATGGFLADGLGAWDAQDQPLFVEMARRAKTACTPVATWCWHHHGANTSGLPSRWPVTQ
jgi:glycosyltransferase involved in cell wall biosynthesis